MAEQDKKVLDRSDAGTEKGDSLAEQLTATLERQVELVREQNRIMRAMLLARN